ncbi:hypothetical protein ACFLZH_02995 [Patescibacteria group bacterium]
MDDKKPVSDQGKQLVDQTLVNKGVDEYVQDMINKPQIDPTGIDDTDLEFMKKVIALVENKTIDVHTPETLLNKKVYDGLEESAQGKADLNGVNLLNEIRQIKILWDKGDRDSFQIQNLIQRMRHTKQRVEKEIGNCYII